MFNPISVSSTLRSDNMWIVLVSGNIHRTYPWLENKLPFGCEIEGMRRIKCSHKGLLALLDVIWHHQADSEKLQ